MLVIGAEPGGMDDNRTRYTRVRVQARCGLRKIVVVRGIEWTDHSTDHVQKE